MVIANDDADCNLHEIADEREYMADNSYNERSRSNDGKSACTSTSNLIAIIITIGITMSGKVDARIRILYDKRRRSLDRIEHIRIEERRRLKQICTFKPDISSCMSSHKGASTATKLAVLI